MMNTESGGCAGGSPDPGDETSSAGELVSGGIPSRPLPVYVKVPGIIRDGETVYIDLDQFAREYEADPADGAFARAFHKVSLLAHEDQLPEPRWWHGIHDWWHRFRKTGD